MKTIQLEVSDTIYQKVIDFCNYPLPSKEIPLQEPFE
jgi:hypothetical protein